MAGVKGKTGNPGEKNPNKKSSTSFTVEEGKEPKGRQMGFRPPVSLEQRIDEHLAATGMKISEFLEDAAIAYLENPPELAEGKKTKTKTKKAAS